MAVRILIVLTLLTAGISLTDPLFADTRLGIVPLPETAYIRLPDRGDALVQEYCHLPLGKGVNQVAFTWSGRPLDPDTVRFTPLEEPESVNVLTTKIPPDGGSLIWEIDCQKGGVVPVAISYLPAGLDSLTTYKATVNAGETTLNLDADLVLRNFSGQSYPLATVWLDPDTEFSTQILARETRQIPFSIPSDTQIKKRFHWDGQTMPHDPEHLDSYPGVPFGYQLTLSAGTSGNPRDLRGGKVRLFLEDAGGRQLFTGEDTLPFLPGGDTFFLETGRSRDLVITKRRMTNEKTGIRRNDKGVIQVLDQTITDRFILKNTSDTPADVRLVDRIPGQWKPVNMGHAYTLEDHETLRFDILVDAGETRTFDLTYTILNIFPARFAEFNQVTQP
jgi:hypothetical protein